MTENSIALRLSVWVKKNYPDVIFAHDLMGCHLGEEQRAFYVNLRNPSRGYPDLFIAEPLHGYHGLYLEEKVEKGGVVSSEQNDIHQRLRLRGYKVEVGKGLIECKNIIREYLGEERPKKDEAYSPVKDGLTEEEEVAFLFGL